MNLNMPILLFIQNVLLSWIRQTWRSKNVLWLEEELLRLFFLSVSRFWEWKTDKMCRWLVPTCFAHREVVSEYPSDAAGTDLVQMGFLNFCKQNRNMFKEWSGCDLNRCYCIFTPHKLKFQICLIILPPSLNYFEQNARTKI